MYFIIDEKVVSALLGYLGKRPYAEVANIIAAMNSMQSLEAYLKSLENSKGQPDSTAP